MNQHMFRPARYAKLCITIGAVAVGAIMVINAVGTPLREKHQRRNTLRAEIELRQAQLQKAGPARQQFDAFQQRSISSDPALFVLVCQEWLVKLGKHLELTNVLIRPSPPIRYGSLGFRVAISLSAGMSSEQLGRLIDQAEQNGYLLRVTRVEVKRQPASDDELAFHPTVVVFEGLSLKQQTKVTHAMTIDDVEPRLARLFAARDPFARYRSLEPPATPEPITPEIVVDAELTTPAPTRQVALRFLADIQLVGVFTKDGQHQAWFFDYHNQQELVAFGSGPFTINQEPCVITQIGDDYVLLKVAGEQQRLAVGERITVADPSAL